MADTTIEELRRMLYLAVRELAYVDAAEDICQCQTALGREIVERGMAMLGVKDLSTDTLPGSEGA